MTTDQTDPIIWTENQLSGNADWELERPAMNREIEGYASHTSINRGDSIDLYVNTKAKFFNMAVYRMGWYSGRGARLVTKFDALKGTIQEVPEPDKLTGMVECQWSNPIHIRTDKNWVTGVYLVKLEEQASRRQSYILFVVRNDEDVHDILFQLPVTTYQAYNFWGGQSLYDFGSGDPLQWGCQSGIRASKVSFLRPYARSNNRRAAYGMGAGEFLTNVQPTTTHFLPISSAAWDYNMVRWLERNGYQVGYCTNIDTHLDGRIAEKAKIFMSHGHDEYWSRSMRQNVRNALSQGIHLAFFSSNTMFWQIRLEGGTVHKDALTTMVCYKDAVTDPEKDNGATVNFRDEPINEPESALIGVQHFMDPVDCDILITRPDHWICEGTGFSKGSVIKGLAGYEIDRISPDSPKNIEIIASSPAKNLLENNYHYVLLTMENRVIRKITGILSRKLHLRRKWVRPMVWSVIPITLFGNYHVFEGLGLNGWVAVFVSLVAMLALTTIWFLKSLRALNGRIVREGHTQMTLYQSNGGAMVFATGTMQWAWGLDDYNAPDLRTSRSSPQASRMTHNILQRFGARTSSKIDHGSTS